jgi:hypothetical protein
MQPINWDCWTWHRAGYCVGSSTAVHIVIVIVIIIIFFLHKCTFTVGLCSVRGMWLYFRFVMFFYRAYISLHNKHRSCDAMSLLVQALCATKLPRVAVSDNRGCTGGSVSVTLMTIRADRNTVQIYLNVCVMRWRSVVRGEQVYR